MTVEDILRQLKLRKACLANGCRASLREGHAFEYAIRESRLNLLEDIIHSIERKN